MVHKPTLREHLTQTPELKSRWSPDNPSSLLDKTIGSNQEAEWYCPTCKQTLSISIVKKTKKPDLCTICAGLTIIPGINDLTVFHPELATEWSKTNDKEVTQVSRSSGYVAIWVCNTDKEHTPWTARVCDRTTKGNTYGTCPTCQKDKAYARKLEIQSAFILPDGDQVPTVMKDFFRGFVNKGRYQIPSFASPVKCSWECDKGHQWVAQAATMAKAPKCTICAKGERTLPRTHPSLVAEWGEGNDREPAEVTAGSAYRAKWTCVTHPSHTWEAHVYARTAGSRCPHCFGATSDAERIIADYVKELLGSNQVETSDRKTVNPHELDIYIPAKKIAIEFNGLYWHSEEAGKDRNYHKNKWEACQKAGIQLIQVWEDEWNRNPEQVKQMLAHKLGAPYGDEKRVMARKTQAVEITKLQAEKFLDKNHVQQHANGSYYLGLIPKNMPKTKYEQDDILAVLVLKKEAATEGKTLNIIRYATAAIIPGGFTKLLTHAERAYQPEQFLTFSDNCVSDGGLYRNNGFVADKQIRPDYMYVTGKERRHKFGYRLKRFRNDPVLKWEEGLTESQLAKLNNIPRVWDAGKTRWVKKVVKKS